MHGGSHAGIQRSRAGIRSVRGAGSRRVRGPAPSHNLCEFSTSAVPASRLLRDVRSRHGVVAAAILYVRMPSGVTQRAGSGRELSPASPCGTSTAASALAASVAAAAMTSFAVVPTYSPHEDRTYPQDGEGHGRVPVHRSPRSFPLRVGIRRVRPCVPGRTSR